MHNLTKLLSQQDAYGKVLILGGYLILFPQFSGIVLSCSCKIQSTLSLLPSSSYKLSLLSPQFNLSCDFSLSPFSSPSNSNIFLTESLKTASFFISLYKPITVHDLLLTIQADPAFYTSGKTGLGSSAALTTSIVKALFAYYQLTNTNLLHFVASLAHFRAQKKVGSGFDITSAVYGSLIFQRKQSLLMNRLVDKLNTTNEEVENELMEWKTPEKFELPKGYFLVLCCCEKSGSNTRIMVQKVVKWVEQDKAWGLFAEVQRIIYGFCESLKVRNKGNLRKLSKELKGKLAQLSEMSEVDVLPAEIRKVLEEVEDKLEDVVFASVPGAGGYDAFFFIVEKPSFTEARDYLLSSFPGLNILPVTQR
jgi:phosphomevalonate kinase